MMMGFIQHLKSSWDKPLDQLPADRIGNKHFKALTV
jgi:hypothetical protein